MTLRLPRPSPPYSRLLYQNRHAPTLNNSESPHDIGFYHVCVTGQLHAVVQYSTVQYSTVQYSTVQYSTVQ
jgi:hypothetical protein